MSIYVIVALKQIKVIYTIGL